MQGRETRDTAGALTVTVAGGSIGGLCAAVALRGIGCSVDVYERTPGPMSSRGAGIVVQPDLQNLLRWASAPRLPTTACSARRYLQPVGTDSGDTPMPQLFTSWDAIYRTLRAAFPDEQYHSAAALSDFEQQDGRILACFDGHGSVEADLLVCADGWRSETRKRLLPGERPHYAGYVAWRGTLDEGDAPPGLAEYFDDRFTFCEARSGGHALCYLIPGVDAATEPGRRRLNWVWYMHTQDNIILDRLLTTRDGDRRDGSVPPGLVPDDRVSELHDAARRELHPRFEALVRATPQPFLQAILDQASPRMVFERVCLLGDAAFVVRPHTAAATAKAAADAASLASALHTPGQDVDVALTRWNGARVAAGMALTRHGVALGERTAAAR